MLATLAMFVTGVAVLVWPARQRPAGDVMPVDMAVLGHDMRTSRSPTALAIGPPSCRSEPVWPKYVVAVALARHLR